MFQIKELSAREKFYWYFKELLKIGMNFQYTKIMKNRRTRKLVKDSYNEATWKIFLRSNCWEFSSNLNNFVTQDYWKGLFGGVTKKVSLIDNKICKVNSCDFSVFNEKKLPIFKKFISEEDEIVEIGCGSGSRLFFLRSVGFKNKMKGIDISENGIDTALKINKKFGTNIEFQVHDIIENFNSKLENKTILSFHTMEQLKFYTNIVISNLIQMKPKQVLHFEPVPEIYSTNLKDTISKLYIYANEYQNNLLKTLQGFSQKRLIKITDTKRLGHGENPFNETTFIRWIPM